MIFTDTPMEICGSIINACTSVPTVFLGCGKTEFKLPVSFFVYPRHRKTEFEIPFSFSVFPLHWKWNCNFYFRFSFSCNFGQQNSNCHFLFSSFVFVRYWKTEIELRFSIFVSVFSSLSYVIWGLFLKRPKHFSGPQSSFLVNLKGNKIMCMLSQITELNCYLVPTIKSKRFSTKACHNWFGTYSRTSNNESSAQISTNQCKTQSADWSPEVKCRL